MSYKKAVTIRDVAQGAGVSIATVSRVLNFPDQVKTETRQRVQAVMAELQFVPPPAQEQKRSQASKENLVYLMLPNLFNESIAAIAQGAADLLAQHQINTLVWNCNESIDLEQQGRQFIQSHSAQGAIVILSAVEDIPLSPLAAKMPVVAVEQSRQEKGVDYLIIDDDQAMHLLVEHLVSLGHREIAFLCGDISSSNAARKITAFKKALQAFGLPWQVDHVLSTQWNMESGYQSAQKLLEWSPEVTAIICITDLLAVGAIHGLQAKGLLCPEEISVVGMDHVPGLACLHPQLTTLDYPSYQMGQDAAQRILDRIQQRKQPDLQKTYPVTLLPGQSSGPSITSK